MGDCVGNRKSLVERNTVTYCNQRCDQLTEGIVQKLKPWKPKFENSALCRDWSKKKAVPKTPAEWAGQQYQVAARCPSPQPRQALVKPEKSTKSLGIRKSLVERNTGPYCNPQRVQLTGGIVQQPKPWKPKFENPELCRDWSKKKAVPKTPAEWASLQYQTSASHVRPQPQQRSQSQPSRLEAPKTFVNTNQPPPPQVLTPENAQSSSQTSLNRNQRTSSPSMPRHDIEARLEALEEKICALKEQLHSE